MDNRRGFLQKILVGMAAAPAVAAADSLTGKAPDKTDQIQVRRWERGGVKFAEFTMPVGVPPFFKRENDTTQRYVMLQPFDWEAAEKAGQTKAELVAACIESQRKYDRPVNLPVTTMDDENEGVIVGTTKRVAFADRFKNNTELFAQMTPNTNVTIVRVHGRPHVMAITATSYPLVPRSDYYDVKRVPDTVANPVSRQLNRGIHARGSFSPSMADQHFDEKEPAKEDPEGKAMSDWVDGLAKNIGKI